MGSLQKLDRAVRNSAAFHSHQVDHVDGQVVTAGGQHVRGHVDRHTTAAADEGQGAYR